MNSGGKATRAGRFKPRLPAIRRTGSLRFPRKGRRRGRSCRRKPGRARSSSPSANESNFAPTAFTFRGRRYASLEGFWQMMLCPEGPDDPRATFPGLEWRHTRAEVAQMTSFPAKEAGTLVEDL